MYTKHITVLVVGCMSLTQIHNARAAAQDDLGPAFYSLKEKRQRQEERRLLRASQACNRRVEKLLQQPNTQSKQQILTAAASSTKIQNAKKEATSHGTLTYQHLPDGETEVTVTYRVATDVIQWNNVRKVSVTFQ